MLNVIGVDMMDYANNKFGQLSGKTALVTGGARRLGRAVALDLAQRGVNIIVHYNRSADEAAALAGEIESWDVKAWLIQADLTDTVQAETLLDSLSADVGTIDILINNASIFPGNTVLDVTEASLTENILIHGIAPLFLSRAFARQVERGRIINFLDSRITDYDREHIAYHISKRILSDLTKMLAVELAPGISVNAVAPGLILPPEGMGDDYLRKLAGSNPLQRWGSAEGVADAVLFLLQSDFITGQIIYVDGGRHLRGKMYEG